MSITVKKFSNSLITAKGEERAYIDINQLQILWINTGTLCNIECKNCYIESSPKNDQLSFITHEEVCAYLNEIEADKLETKEIGLTGGEPFMNPDIIPIIETCLARGFYLIVLTNAMQPLQRQRIQQSLLALNKQYSSQLTLRVSIDHFQPDIHERQRGKDSWFPMINGLKWLSDNHFSIDIAGRTFSQQNETELRQGYAELFRKHRINLDAMSAKQLVLFPEMEENTDVPEITTACWEIISNKPENIMCSSSRMIVKRKGAATPSVVACTLLPYEKEFEFASTLKESAKRVYLNHHYCASFCVLGGGSCSVNESH